MARIKQTANKRVPSGPVIARKAIKTVEASKRSREIKVAKPKTRITPVKVSAAQVKESQTIARRVHLRKLTFDRFANQSIPKRPFQRLVKKISQSFIPDARFQSDALLALQQATEDFLVGYFEDAVQCTLHAKRKTLMVKDVQLVRKLRRIEHWAPI